MNSRTEFHYKEKDWLFEVGRMIINTGLYHLFITLMIKNFCKCFKESCLCYENMIYNFFSSFYKKKNILLY